MSQLFGVGFRALTLAAAFWPDALNDDIKRIKNAQCDDQRGSVNTGPEHVYSHS